MSYQSVVSASAPYLWWRMAYMTASNPTPTYHRYWRAFWQTVGGAAVAGIAEIEFHPYIGGPNLLTTTSSVTASTTSGGNVASNAIDGNGSTFWVATSGAGSWWRWDAGSGNSASVGEVKMTAKNDNTYNQGPGTLYVQYSDDAASWTAFWTGTFASWLSNGQVQTVIPPGFSYLVPNEGTGGAALSGIFNFIPTSTCTVVSGAASASNPAYNPMTGVTGAFYLAQPGSSCSIVSANRVHDFDFFNPFDPVQATATWTVEWWARYGGAAPNPAANPWTTWAWGGTDGFVDGLSFNPEQPSSMGYWNCPGCWAISYLSGSAFAFRQRFFEDTWRTINYVDGNWYHLVLLGSGSAWPSNFVTTKLIINGQYGVTQADNQGTWITVSGTAPNYYFRQYSGGSRISVGSSAVSQNGNLASQNGYVADFAIYNRTLSASEIMDHFLAGRRVLSGTLLNSSPVYTVHVPARPVSVPATGTSGGKDARATKTNPGAN